MVKGTLTIAPYRVGSSRPAPRPSPFFRLPARFFLPMVGSPRKRMGVRVSEDDPAGARRDEAILADPRYQRLVSRRGRFTWALTCLMLAAFFGYILLIAFDKSALALPIGRGVTSLGIPVGIGIILLAIALTGLYVRRANRDYDPLIRALKSEEEA